MSKRILVVAVAGEPMGPHIYLGAGGWGLETFSISEFRIAPMSRLGTLEPINKQIPQCYLII
jgi:hypothetical protein